METRILAIILSAFLAAWGYASSMDGPCSAHYLAMHRSSGGAAVGHGMRALACLRNSLSNAAPETVIYRYADTVSTIHFSLEIGTCDEKKKTYRDALVLITKCSANTDTSAAYHLASALLLARIIDCSDPMEIAANAYGERTSAHLNRCMALGNGFLPDVVYLLYGRMHAIAPHIPIIHAWPDRGKAKIYLERSIALRDTLVARFFYADLLYDTGDRERAVRMFRDIARTAPSADDLVSDTKTIAMCKARMKALGITEQ